MDQQRRLQLHEILCGILGSRYAYFQPPSTIQMNYPCIVYSRDYVNTLYADNSPYNQKKRYEIIVIDANPDSTIPSKVGALSLCAFDRHYTKDNLNHDVFKLYF